MCRPNGPRTLNGSGRPPCGTCRISYAPAIRATKRKLPWPKPAPTPWWRGWTAMPKGFAEAARESDCGSKVQGGHLGQLGPGDTVPEFEAALRTLYDGQTTPAPVLSRHGWHIIRLNAIAPGQVLLMRPCVRRSRRHWRRRPGRAPRAITSKVGQRRTDHWRKPGADLSGEKGKVMKGRIQSDAARRRFVSDRCHASRNASGISL